MMKVPAALKAMRARANALAHEGMRLHGYAEDDHKAWSVFYNHTYEHIQRCSHLKQSIERMAQVYEIADDKVKHLKELL